METGERHNVWLVASGQLHRDGLTRLLQSAGLPVSGAFENHEDAVAAEDRPLPDAILLVIGSGFEQLPAALGALHDRMPQIPVVVLAQALTLSELRLAMGAGASGYLVQDIRAQALVQALVLVIAGEKVLPTGAVDILLQGTVAGMVPADVRLDFTDQEAKVLSGIAQGHTNKQIAHDLQIAEGTVKIHAKAVYRKIGVKNRTEAAIWVLERGYRDDSPYG